MPKLDNQLIRPLIGGKISLVVLFGLWLPTKSHSLGNFDFREKASPEFTRPLNLFQDNILSSGLNWGKDEPKYFRHLGESFWGWVGIQKI